MDILFDKKTTQLVYLLTLTFPILYQNDPLAELIWFENYV